ncbi:MAG TPA: right-handed parallel beta-helix repeat-containing protein [Herpetosiphonaceae bacterium]
MSQPSPLNEGIKVFYSYSHKDERIRNELANHLSILRRQGVISEWHDRKIGAGDEWAGEIDQHLNTAQIILLLISSDFLASDYCYDIEMKRAMERHDAGEARVIPVVLRPVMWLGTPFSRLQALPKDAKAVTLWRTSDEAFVSVAEGIREAVEEIKRLSRLQVRNIQQNSIKERFRTLVVDQMHRGDHVTINEAINAAKPGDRILVRPGFYQEVLVIDKPVEIIGDGLREEIVIQSRENHIIWFEATMSRVVNITLQQIGRKGYWFGVVINQGRLDLEDCDITSQNWASVAIRDGADARLRRNRIHGGSRTGIIIFEGQAILEENDIVANYLHGIELHGGGNLIARHNRISKSGYEAICIEDGGSGTFEDNDLRDNAGGAWFIDNESLPNVKRARNIEE